MRFIIPDLTSYLLRLEQRVPLVKCVSTSKQRDPNSCISEKFGFPALHHQGRRSSGTRRHVSTHSNGPSSRQEERLTRVGANEDKPVASAFNSDFGPVLCGLRVTESRRRGGGTLAPSTQLVSLATAFSGTNGLMIMCDPGRVGMTAVS